MKLTNAHSHAHKKFTNQLRKMHHLWQKHGMAPRHWLNSCGRAEQPWTPEEVFTTAQTPPPTTKNTPWPRPLWPDWSWEATLKRELCPKANFCTLLQRIEQCATHFSSACNLKAAQEDNDADVMEWAVRRRYQSKKRNVSCFLPPPPVAMVRVLV